MHISIIAAMSENRVIGKDNKLPWHLPADLKRLKSLTIHKPIIMGRKTFLSLGKPLPHRHHIVITRDKNFNVPEGVSVVFSLQDAIDKAKQDKTDEIIIFGGAEIFRKSLPLVTRMYLTIIHKTMEGDTYFPEWNHSEWHEISREKFSADEKNQFDYTFLVLEHI